MSGAEPGWQGHPPMGPEARPPGDGGSGSRGMLVLALVIVAVSGVVLGLALTWGDDGGDGGPSTDAAQEPTAGELIPGLAEGMYDRSDGALTHDEATCTAEQVVQGIGAGRLADLGVQAGDTEVPFDRMAEGEQRRMAAWMFDCVSDDRLVEYVAGLLPPENPFEQRLCLAEGQVRMLGTDRAREMWVEFTVNPEADLYSTLENDRERDAMVVLEEECFGPPGGSPGTGGTGG